IQFGFILLNTIIIYVYVTLCTNVENLLHHQKTRIDELFRVLFHDLANPLGRISIGLNIASRHCAPNPQWQKGIHLVSEATENMIEMTQNVRKMYAASKGKVDI